ncbi:MAG TPA: GntR family transcriptional regulator [Pseudorhodoplanes sp.]|nr:GntR family transcriptional regulator [Pseudorhodoplanes sp.]
MERLTTSEKLADRAYGVILDAICDGTLKPGERLTQASVAERLNVSRQPVHNALQVLKAQGFVREFRRRGLCVAPIDADLFEAIYQLRSAVEPLAVRLATARAGKADFDKGRKLIEQGVVAAVRKGGALVAADMRFHAWIYDLSGNPLIVETMRLNWRHLQRGMGEVLRHAALSKRVWDEHRAILDAMSAGEGEQAALLIRDHVMTAYRDVRTILAHDAAGGV